MNTGLSRRLPLADMLDTPSPGRYCVPLRCLLFLALFGTAAGAQLPDTASRAPRAEVGGIVWDSVAGSPLSGAVVQLVGLGQAPAAHSTTSDSLGHFRIADVVAGRYMLGFLHPVLDVLGLEPPVREVLVGEQPLVRADLALPSAGRLRAAICGARSAADSGGVVVGVVRDARDGAAVRGALVTAEWFELSIGAGTLGRRRPRLAATTTDNGWFAICNLPRTGSFTLFATRGADSTGVIEIDMPPEGLHRRELYLAQGSGSVATDTATRGDSQLGPRGPTLTGGARLSGVVVTALDGLPVSGAQVTIAGGPRAESNELGEWSLAGVPLGTRTLEVRAVGYFPARRAVDVVADAPPLRIALSTMKAVLDTVRVTASPRAERHMREFEERRRMGGGRYLTAEDVARLRPPATSDLFNSVAGLNVIRVPNGASLLQMRRFGESCYPGVYIDGHYMHDLTADDIDDWVNPEEIAGIEIYSSTVVPPQFSQGMSGVGRSAGTIQECGSVVIWTKARSRSSGQTSWRGQLIRVAGFTTLMVVVGRSVSAW